jgi:quaternary ammonium compound-resistance protein SugE
MAWIYLTIAGLFEIGWAIGLKYTEGFTRLLPSLWTIASMILSIVLLGLALKTLPVGTAYAVWSGPGSARSAPPRSASICSRNRRPWRGCSASA